jgi:hypothetical protein
MPLTRSQLANKNTVFNEIRAHYAAQVGAWTANNLQPAQGAQWTAPPDAWLNQAANQNAYSVTITTARHASYRVDILARDAHNQVITYTVGVLGQ